MFYTTNEVAALLTYSCPQTFLYAAKKKNNQIVNEIWEARIAAKIGKRILFRKEEVDNILKKFKLV
jgi:hypothetical protein